MEGSGAISASSASSTSLTEPLLSPMTNHSLVKDMKQLDENRPRSARGDDDETSTYSSSIKTTDQQINSPGTQAAVVQFETGMLDVEETDRMFLKASFITIVVWLFCICLVFASSTPREKLEGTEREAAAIAFWMLFVIFIVVWLLTSWPSSKTSISGRSPV